ncbi:hypothetical protein J4457_02670 [Candidatus Woesearchaeota archaeon]|nr:hypothetical protein [Candidatus Woesearchaeota archaeon]
MAETYYSVDRRFYVERRSKAQQNQGFCAQENKVFCVPETPCVSEHARKARLFYAMTLTVTFSTVPGHGRSKRIYFL